MCFCSVFYEQFSCFFLLVELISKSKLTIKLEIEITIKMKYTLNRLSEYKIVLIKLNKFCS